MGFLDRIKASLGSASVDAEAAGPQGPLALSVGDVVRHYADQWVVSGVRALDGPAGAVHHYCLRDETGEWLVLSVAEGQDGYWLERRVDLPPPGDVLDGLADEPLHRTAEETYRCRTVGDTGVTPSRSVRVEVFEDDEGESRLVVESHGGLRTARLGESAHEGELAFGDESAAADARPWAAVAVGESDDTTHDDEAEDEGELLARLPKGTPGAAAAALEGRLAHLEGVTDLPEVADVDDERQGYADDEWADAHDDGPAPQRYKAGRDPDESTSVTSDDWLASTQFVAGAEKTVRQDDDWLTD